MPFNPLVSLRFSAPFSFFLCFYERSTVVMLGAIFYSVSIYISVKGWIVYLILLKSYNVLVQLSLGFGVDCLVICVRVCQIGCVKLEVRWVID